MRKLDCEFVETVVVTAMEKNNLIFSWSFEVLFDCDNFDTTENVNDAVKNMVFSEVTDDIKILKIERFYRTWFDDENKFAEFSWTVFEK